MKANERKGGFGKRGFPLPPVGWAKPTMEQCVSTELASATPGARFTWT